MSDQEKMAREFVRNNGHLTRESSRDYYRSHLRRGAGNLGQLIEAARQGFPEAIEFLRSNANNTDLLDSEGFRRFVSDYFVGGPPKVKPGQKSEDLAWRNLAAWALVNQVHYEFGFPLRRKSGFRDTKTPPSRLVRLLPTNLAWVSVWLKT